MTDKEYRQRHAKKHKSYNFFLDKEKDKDIIKWLSHKTNVSRVIRESLREAMQNETEKAKKTD